MPKPKPRPQGPPAQPGFRPTMQQQQPARPANQNAQPARPANQNVVPSTPQKQPRPQFQGPTAEEKPFVMCPSAMLCVKR